MGAKDVRIFINRRRKQDTFTKLTENTVKKDIHGEMGIKPPTHREETHSARTL